jgi:cell division protein FtsB
MTKQEQIEEMAKIVDEMYNVYTTTADDIAEGLYNAGYRKIDDLETENKQLKTECALLDDELRIARQDTIDVLSELKKKAYVNNYCREVVEVEKIDEMIKELTK